MRRIIILLVLSIACSFQLHAQNSTQGKEFWFTFMQNGYKYNGGGWVSNRVMISAKKNLYRYHQESEQWLGGH